MQALGCGEKGSQADSAFWQNTALRETLANIDNAQKSMTVLKKHLPKKYYRFIRFAQPKTVWYLNVEQALVATQLNWLLDDLCLRIAKDIGYAPRLRVMVKPQHWALSGFPLETIQPIKKSLPTATQADQIISDFLSRSIDYS
ncbi:MAG: hypothetical protein CSA47_00995 [Gammaproteobacteria bacterium]|nr:MAG: hypothetical protein CSA47_00995 [Gammaproteobacteria bacterium]